MGGLQWDVTGPLSFLEGKSPEPLLRKNAGRIILETGQETSNGPHLLGMRFSWFSR